VCVVCQMKIKMWSLPRRGEEDLRKSRLLYKACFLGSQAHLFLSFISILVFLMYDVDEINVRGITLCLGLN
jgi:hypothetical protein